MFANPGVITIIYMWGLFILCLGYSLKLNTWNNTYLLSYHDNQLYALILAFVIILIMGLRPINGGFGDTLNYANRYYAIAANPQLALYELLQNDTGERLFTLLMIAMAFFDDATIFFLIIEILYVGCTFIACFRIFRSNVFAAFLITICSFSYFSYGTNGIRNGLACAIILVAVSLANKSLFNKLLAIILCLCALEIHKSTLLPSLAMLVAYFINNFKPILFFWVLSLFISALGFSDSISHFFESFGFDDRYYSYLEGAKNVEFMNQSFSNVGFRWDFVLYSAVPIAIGWIVLIKNQVQNNTYSFLLNIYTICNAFWILVIRASFSNRFAYLSWFILPLVLAFPFLKINIWNHQSRKVALLILGNIIFTLIIS